jgi:adenylosuccinate synthase
LDSVDPIRICVGYRLNGKRVSVPPCDALHLENCEPIYEEMPGWKTATTSAKKLSQLPKAARNYVRRLGELTGASVSIVSVGPTRAQTIFI